MPRDSNTAPFPPPPPPRRPRLLAKLLRRPWPPLDVLVLKTGVCPLCDEAVTVLRRHARRLGLSVRVVDIQDRPDLMETFGEQVPVVFVEGRRRFAGRVDPALLRRLARGERRRRPPEAPASTAS